MDFRGSSAGFSGPGVVVSYTSDQNIHTGKAFVEQGFQTAAGSVDVMN